jgi:hypothetical protein
VPKDHTLARLNPPGPPDSLVYVLDEVVQNLSTIIKGGSYAGGKKGWGSYVPKPATCEQRGSLFLLTNLLNLLFYVWLR